MLEEATAADRDDALGPRDGTLPFGVRCWSPPSRIADQEESEVPPHPRWLPDRGKKPRSQTGYMLSQTTGGTEQAVELGFRRSVALA